MEIVCVKSNYFLRSYIPRCPVRPLADCGGAVDFMKKKQVPQDSSTTYAGHRKIIYATDENDKYNGEESSGWNVEEFATLSAVNEFKNKAEDARQRVLANQVSALEYHMYAQRMDLPTLSQISGFFQWQIKRHFRPAVFNKLKPKILEKYSDALGMSPVEIKMPLSKFIENLNGNISED